MTTETVTIYEDNAGGITLARGTDAWGLVWPDRGAAEADCAAWLAGEWSPNESDGQVRQDWERFETSLHLDHDTTHVIAVYSRGGGLVLGPDPVGGGGASYLGIEGP